MKCLFLTSWQIDYNLQFLTAVHSRQVQSSKNILIATAKQFYFSSCVFTDIRCEKFTYSASLRSILRTRSGCISNDVIMPPARSVPQQTRTPLQYEYECFSFVFHGSMMEYNLEMA
ncbi:hypothetical protein NQ315_003736 [Exocentrus adspersus]|uniref:Uncharacterized protein n=1 Tax=Exocentrus adspersus TaxID=1586481 RepID=A0AAV8VIB1_9CUCU|nr:hypothetical protein NQ315_003736 [Exocentrus adspersus]